MMHILQTQDGYVKKIKPSGSFVVTSNPMEAVRFKMYITAAQAASKFTERCVAVEYWQALEELIKDLRKNKL